MGTTSDRDILRQLIRFEMDPSMFDTNAEEEYELCYSETYKPSYLDLQVACENMCKAHIDVEAFVNWFCYVSDNLAEYYEGAWDVPEDCEFWWAETDEEQFLYMGDHFEAIFHESDEIDSELLRELLENIRNSAEIYDRNRNLPREERTLTERQKSLIFMRYMGDSESIPEEKRAWFRAFVDAESEQDNLDALYIKGYGCYGGDALYPCDWEASRRAITRLFTLTDRPQYANTLGYIYYYGRCNNGVPEYEKAFHYFSIGAACKVIESMYKLADMFLSGKGCIKSSHAGWKLIGEVYEDSKVQFEHGSDAKFADLALRMGSYYREKERWEEALPFYLEAEYAIRCRMAQRDFFGDKKVERSIREALAETKEALGTEFFKTSYESPHPQAVYAMLEHYTCVYFRITELSEGHYRMEADGGDDLEDGKMFLVDPFLAAATLSDSFCVEFQTEEPIEYYVDDVETMCCDRVYEDTNGEIVFYNGTDQVFAIKNAKYLLSKKNYA